MRGLHRQQVSKMFIINCKNYNEISGEKMFIVGFAGNDVNEYTLSVAWDVSSASFVDSFSVASKDTAPNGMFL